MHLIADHLPLIPVAPWIMAFIFGLLHGFGFVGALGDIGLPRDQLAASMLPLNLGIEAGQLIVVGVLLGAAAGKSILRLPDGLRGGVLDDRSGGRWGSDPSHA